MTVLWGFINCIFGVILIYVGAINITCGLLPKEQGLMVAEWHGKMIGKKIVDAYRIVNARHGKP